MSTINSTEIKSVPLAEGGKILISVSVAITVLATAWTGLRIYARHLRKVDIQVEDWMIVVALAMLYVMAGFMIPMTVLGGIGHHVTEVPPQNVTYMFKLSYGMQFSYGIGLGLVKLSLCLTIARVFFIKPVKIAAYSAAGLSVAWAMVVILNSLLICRPISMFWNPLAGGTCGDQNAAFAAVGILDVIVDLFIFLIPLPSIFKLQIPLSNRIALVLVFALGVSTMVVGIIRTVKIVTMDFLDPTYTGMIPDLLTILELGVAIIVSSSTILRPVFDRLFHTIVSVTGSANKSEDPNRSRSRALSDGMVLEDHPRARSKKAWTDETSLVEVEDGRRGPYGRAMAMDDHSSEEKILGPHETGYSTTIQSNGRYNTNNYRAI